MPRRTYVVVSRGQYRKMSETRLELGEGSAPKIAELMRGNLSLTPVTVALVFVNVAVFGAMLMHGAGLWNSQSDIQLSWGAGFGPATKDGEWWRLGTALFLHFGIVHLAMNMWALWDAGRLVERLYGHLRFGTIYFASGLTGNLVSLIVQGDRAVSGGASGAVFGVYGALLVCLWRERSQIHAGEFRWLFGGAALFSAATIGLGFLIPGIDNAAHIGGVIAGALVGAALPLPLSATSPSPGFGRWVAMGTYFMTVLGLLLLIPAPSYHWHEELHAREEIRDFLLDDQRVMLRWHQILAAGRSGDATFEQLAGRIESDVTREYRESFEQLSSLHLDPAAPSTLTVGVLKKYAQLQEDASQSLAQALRKNDAQRIREAMEKARQAPYIARGQEPPPPATPVR